MVDAKIERMVDAKVRAEGIVGGAEVVAVGRTERKWEPFGEFWKYCSGVFVE